jgi:hypothetical protein
VLEQPNFCKICLDKLPSPVGEWVQVCL